MRWPFRKTRPAEAAPDPRETGPPPTLAERHRSPVLEALLTRLSGADAPHVVDLGTAIGPNIDSLSRSTGRLQVVDLYGSLRSAEALELSGTHELDAVIQEILSCEPGTVDAILAWDLFDYLNQDWLRVLIAHLRRISNPGGVLFALISTGDHIPDAPQVFRIVDHETLEYSPRSAATRPCPRHPPSEIEGLLRGFSIARTVLLRHGVREYLAVRKP